MNLGFTRRHPSTENRGTGRTVVLMAPLESRARPVDMGRCGTVDSHVEKTDAMVCGFLTAKWGSASEGSISRDVQYLLIRDANVT